jgi:thioesterase domain-containing protein/acyl carrier protein
MIPSSFVLLPALPLTAHGKIDRRALPAPDKIRSAGEGVVEPRNELEEQLAEFWAGLLDYSPIGVTENFFDIGGHSLLALKLQAHVRERFGVELPLTVLFEEATIEHIANYISEQPEAQKSVQVISKQPAPAPLSGPGRVVARVAARLRTGLLSKLGRSSKEPELARAIPDVTPDWQPLVPIQPLGTSAPLFLVHPVGGSVLCYAELSRRLGALQPCFGLRAAPGGSPAPSVEEMARRYVSALRNLRSSGPYLLGGWSFGGLIAYQMAQELLRTGEDVGLLALFDSFPLEKKGRERLEDGSLLRLFVQDLKLQHGQQDDGDDEGWRSRAVPDLLDEAWRELERVDLLPAGTTSLEFVSMWQTYRDNFRALERYEPTPSRAKVTLFMASDAGDNARSPIKSWAPLAKGGLTIEALPGSHYTLLREPVVSLSAAKLSAHLRAFTSGTRTPAPSSRVHLVNG